MRVRERELWLTVIRRAQEDAEGEPLWEARKGREGALRKLARRWLTAERPQDLKFLKEVCEMAGLDEQVDKLVRENRRRYGQA